MPLCYLTLSEKSKSISESDLHSIRKIVANGLNSKSRKLDETHIALRVQHNNRATMLADIELEIYAQTYLRRVFSRDRRANIISSAISQHFGYGCATWINMCMVGYSRVTNEGEYYSDADNIIIRFIQKIMGVSTRKKRE